MPGPRSAAPRSAPESEASSAAPTAGAAARPGETWTLPARPRIVLLVKKSLYRVFVEERKDERFNELLLRGDATVERLQSAHEAHERTVEEVRRALDGAGATITELATELAGPQPGPLTTRDADLVVSIGGDGTLLRASHASVDVPVLGVNSAPEHSVGFFCAARADSFADAIRRAQHGKIAKATLTRMQVSINDRIVAERVLNDALFCHASPAATSRYLVELGPICEEQKSSGFWIGPAAGSTAAQCSAGGKVLPLESDALQLVVREPYTPKGERYRIKHALVQPDEELVVRSKIRDATLFVDGPDDVHRAGFGDVLRFRRAPVPLVVLGLHARRRWGTR